MLRQAQLLCPFLLGPFRQAIFRALPEKPENQCFASWYISVSIDRSIPTWRRRVTTWRKWLRRPGGSGSSSSSSTAASSSVRSPSPGASSSWPLRGRHRTGGVSTLTPHIPPPPLSTTAPLYSLLLQTSQFRGWPSRSKPVPHRPMNPLSVSPSCLMTAWEPSSTRLMS